MAMRDQANVVQRNPAGRSDAGSMKCPRSPKPQSGSKTLRSTLRRSVEPKCLSLGLAVLVAMGALVVALPTLSNGFVDLDDALYTGNIFVSRGLTASGIAFAVSTVTTLYWHPLTWLSYELDVQLYGANPAGYHFTSILLHAVSAGLLFLVLRRIGARPWMSAAGSLLWALHPLRVESFAWIAERKDVLCAVLFLAAILAYLYYAERRPSMGGYATWVGFGALAMMSKPTAVCLPVILLILDFWPLRRRVRIAWLVTEKIPTFMMAGIVAFLTVHGQKESGAMSHLGDVPFLVRLQNAPILFLRYIGKILWPVDLSCFYPYDRHPALLSIISSTVLLSAITVIAIQQRKRRPWLLAGWLWFVVALLPNIGLLQAGRQSIADRFTHLAMIGIVIAVTWTLADWLRTHPAMRQPTVWATYVLLAALTALTIRQIGFWRDSSSLFEHALLIEDTEYIRSALAISLISQQRYSEAEPHLRAAIHLDPAHSDVHNNLANVLLETGRVRPAAEEAAIALRLAPDDISVAETNALISFRQGDSHGTLHHFNRAIERGADPLPIATQFNDMGASFASRGRPQDAEPLIRRAAELSPSLVQARRNLVLVLEDQGRTQEARAALQQALRETGPHSEYEDLKQELSVATSSVDPPL